MGRALDWVIPAAAIVAIEYVIAMWIGFTVGFQYELPTKSYAVTTTTISVLVLTVALLVRLGQFMREAEAHPIARLLSEMHKTRLRIVGILIGFLLVGMQIGVLTWLKTMLPVIQSFWADPPLADADRMIFGRDPWIISHELFGPISGLLDRTYVTWAPVKLAALIALILAPTTFVRSRAIVAFFLTAGTGCLLQYAMPSAGPVFYAQLGLGDQFAAMPIEPWVASARDYLWADFLAGGGKPGTGISAMPSMHVAVALWIALVVRSYFPHLQLLSWAYFLAILIGSVHLGWHYALDGIASIAIAAACWLLAPHVLKLSSLGRNRQGSAPLTSPI